MRQTITSDGVLVQGTNDDRGHPPLLVRRLWKNRTMITMAIASGIR
jgi:hypothetical protein